MQKFNLHEEIRNVLSRYIVQFEGGVLKYFRGEKPYYWNNTGRKEVISDHRGERERGKNKAKVCGSGFRRMMGAEVKQTRPNLYHGKSDGI